jgi:hypothetical protein
MKEMRQGDRAWKCARLMIGPVLARPSPVRIGPLAPWQLDIQLPFHKALAVVRPARGVSQLLHKFAKALECLLNLSIRRRIAGPDVPLPRRAKRRAGHNRHARFVDRALAEFLRGKPRLLDRRERVERTVGCWTGHPDLVEPLHDELAPAVVLAIPVLNGRRRRGDLGPPVRFGVGIK